MYYGGCANDECYFRKAEASFTHISELTQQDKGDNNFSSVEKTCAKLYIPLYCIVLYFYSIL